ncbi:hypothetical protein LSTR_LSTR006900 [Laodelphax striatellus]|uniref:Uncharacterized protein n=1 Tax=Laodelphax striatellus TaxID=195883 RepID=A0A482WKE0_LAOST|nr:hypothetical protein LSTR_LSTR006900 [Laodelphax striatellus]
MVSTVALRSLLAESDQVGRPGVRGPKSIELDGTLLAVGNKSRRQKKSLGLSSEWDTDSGRPGVPATNFHKRIIDRPRQVTWKSVALNRRVCAPQEIVARVLIEGKL